MFWYIVICVMMLYPLSIQYAGDLSGRKTRRLALAVACVILWFFMAMRSTMVGVDTKYYSYAFMQFEDIPLRDLFSVMVYATESETWGFDFEPGYRLLNKFVSWLSPSPHAIIIVNSTLIMLLLYRLIRRESPIYLLSIWLYITLGVYQTEMNVTRNAIAILLVYNGLVYAKKGQFGRYLFVCLLAASIHKGALVFIPLYWLFRHQLTPGRMAALIGAACLVGFVFPAIGPYVRAIVPDSLDHYFETNKEKTETLVVGLLNLTVFMISYLFLNQAERRRLFSECRAGMMMFLLNLCFFGLNIGLSDAARMAALFGPYLIVFIPEMISLIESKVRKRYAVTVLSIACGCQYVMRLCINNIGGTMPYRFFW